MTIHKETIDQMACLFLEYDDRALYLAPETSKGEREAIVRCSRGRANKTLSQAILLMKARTDTEHFHALPSGEVAVCFVTGRLVFPVRKGSAPFPSALVYFGGDSRRFARFFDSIGKTIMFTTLPLVDWRTLKEARL